MRRARTAAGAILTGVALALSGCGSDTEDAGTAATSASTSSEAADFLDERDLGGLSTKELIDELDRSSDDFAQQLVGSVRYDSLQLTDGESGEEITLPIEDDFYLSVAPYVEATHDCYYHNLASCQGELVEQDLDVTITQDDGAVLVDETVTTYPNGFVGFWLPRDIAGTITVEYDGKSVEAPFATNADSPTCVTTLQLS